jgi:two-component system NarL family sensor kinase
MHLSIMIVIGICAMLTLAMGIIFFVILYQRRVIAHQVELKKTNEQKELELIQASIRSEEKERMRIASELHDDVNATLSSARLFLYKEPGGKYADEAIGQAKALLDESMLKIRTISHKLQPAILQHLGLEQSLQALIETIGKTGAITARHAAIKPLPRMNDTMELSAYRIAQEMVANILKHSQATTLYLETDAGDEQITLLFTHDGQGLTQDTYESLIYKQGATGLKNIVSRLKSMNAAIQYYVTDGLWYTMLTLPYELKPADQCQ